LEPLVGFELDQRGLPAGAGGKRGKAMMVAFLKAAGGRVTARRLP
jgi:hypothetical protein